jgi:AcrR family transcriptional regulator
MSAVAISRDTKQRPKRSIGIRVKAQVEREQRILEAAEEVFHERGFEGAGMREIAKRAGVGTGTLFLYAADKRGLLLLVHSNHLVAGIERGFSSRDRSAPLVDQIVHVLREQYRYLATDLRLSLYSVQGRPEINGKMSEYATARHQWRRSMIRQRMTELIAAEQRRGNVIPDVDPAAVSRIALGVYSYEVRDWLISSEVSEKLDVPRGIAQLQKQLSIALAGVVRDGKEVIHADDHD